MNKEYIGDGVYVDMKDNVLILTTENGIHTTNIIYLEPDIYMNLVNYVKEIRLINVINSQKEE